MAEADGKIRIKVDLDSADAEREMQGLSGKFSTTLKKVATMAAVGTAVKATANASIRTITQRVSWMVPARAITVSIVSPPVTIYICPLIYGSQP